MTKMMKVSISAPTTSHQDRFVRMTLLDAESSLQVMVLELAMADFAKCLFGLGRVEAEVVQMIEPPEFSHLGKERQVKSISVSKVNPDGTNRTNLEIIHAIDDACLGINLERDGENYGVLSYGTNTQQPHPGHVATLVRFV